MEINNVKITHPDKILFPASAIKKADTANYYNVIAKYMLPYLKSRPLSLKHYPEGIDKPGFFHKHAAKHYPNYIKRVKVEMSSTGSSIEMITATNAKDLVYFAGQNTIEIHISLSQVSHIHQPDQIILDLDPSDNDFEKIRKVALIAYDYLNGHDLPCFVKTTGSRGLHIHIPIKPSEEFKVIKPMAKDLALAIHQLCPEITTLEQRKSKRGNKVFIDYLRNDYGMTAIAPYSLRAIESASIATPIHWYELKEKTLHPQSFNISNIFKRLDNLKDPWQGFL